MQWWVITGDAFGPKVFEETAQKIAVSVSPEGELQVQGCSIPESVVERLYRAARARQAHAAVATCPHTNKRNVERKMVEVCYDCYGARSYTLEGEYGPWELETGGIMRPQGWLQKEPWPPPDLVPGWCDPDSPYFNEELTIQADIEATEFEGPEVSDDILDFLRPAPMEDEGVEVLDVNARLESLENNEGLAQWADHIERNGLDTLKPGLPPINGHCRCQDCKTVWTAAIGSKNVLCLRCDKLFEPKVMVRVAEKAEPFPDVLRDFVPQTYGDALKQSWIEEGDCEPHEWDNRTSAENAKWMIEQLRTKLAMKELSGVESMLGVLSQHRLEELGADERIKELEAQLAAAEARLSEKT